MIRKRPTDEIRVFEKAAAEPDGQKFILCLYVSGQTKKAERAVTNLREICDEHLKGRYELRVIDISKHPKLAKDEQIFATPALIKKLPLPLRKLIGDMSDQERVLVGINLLPQKQ